ncbi:MAG: hypothetical protein WD046_13900 [Paracoccaceae bacterium]
MFKIAPALFTREITARVPVDGGFENQTMKVTYETLASDKAEALLDIKRGNQGMRDFVSAICVRVDELVDETGKPLEWNDTVKAQLLALPYAFGAIREGYLAAMTAAQAKN